MFWALVAWFVYAMSKLSFELSLCILQLNITLITLQLYLPSFPQLHRPTVPEKILKKNQTTFKSHWFIADPKSFPVMWWEQDLELPPRVQLFPIHFSTNDSFCCHLEPHSPGDNLLQPSAWSCPSSLSQRLSRAPFTVKSYIGWSRVAPMQVHCESDLHRISWFGKLPGSVIRCNFHPMQMSLWKREAFSFAVRWRCVSCNLARFPKRPSPSFLLLPILCRAAFNCCFYRLVYWFIHFMSIERRAFSVTRVYMSLIVTSICCNDKRRRK